jgi:hypothetical protein
MAYLDLVADLLERVSRRTGTPKQVLQDIEREARAEWGGSRHYVAKGGECAKVQLMQRDARIRADHRQLVAAGMDPSDADEYLARRHSLGVRRIRQILGGGEPSRAPA